jgi:hypothetical protein
MERSEIYQKIDKERAYQAQRWNPERFKADADKDIATWLLYIEEHLNKAKHELYYGGEEEACDGLRKIAALAVAAMEVHGCPDRTL